ncbi:PREDICTED: islet cell autoantigen 1-like isoform X2 [Priapulus caudatus]|uniref:Islet cell autoantigen 1-like isoform X2 n=1 Tax=Priapulus caudatus TaxID=37621 RepID=A0ABM1E4S0_PRICU|nr:PREDICTED: islet cell autoantigen 1-like isoform X2 [Priapulus caudatus]
MSGYYSGRGYDHASYDQYGNAVEPSAIGKLQQQYWLTKQTVIKKIGKQEDEFVVAGDAELDTKLELFEAIQQSCAELLRVIERYQDGICALSQEENCMGRFLKEQGKIDKTRAGKMLVAVGKTEGYSAQQRLAIRVPLVRLYNEVETFQYRAISDTYITIRRMEKARTEYRAALLWMKDVSQELDPDTFKRLEKFRKVQGQVRKTKAKFDRLKVDCIQKIDLLAASRCNMFSHVLANYQSTLLHFWKKTSTTMGTVLTSFKGYQHYEFNMLKELAEPCKKLVEQTSTVRQQAEKEGDSAKGEDVVANKTEEEEEEEGRADKETASLINIEEEESNKALMQLDRLLQDSSPIEECPPSQLLAMSSARAGRTLESPRAAQNDPQDLLSDDYAPDDSQKDDMVLLNEILNVQSSAVSADDFSKEWQAVFGSQSLAGQTNYTPVESDAAHDNRKQFMPSQMLDMRLDSHAGATMQADQRQTQTAHPYSAWAPAAAALQCSGVGLLANYPSTMMPYNGHTLAGPMLPRPSASVGQSPRAVLGESSVQAVAWRGPAENPSPAEMCKNPRDSANCDDVLEGAGAKPMMQQQQQQQKQTIDRPAGKKPDQKADMSAWFNLFADLDPLSNPDAVGHQEAAVDDRNC